MLEELKIYREQIDIIDEEIMRLLKKRELIVKEIIRYKLKNNIPIEQLAREVQICNRPEDKYMRDIFKIIIKVSKKLQKKIHFLARISLSISP
ncbi:MAG TPA: chorismate mutase [Candidatus Eremiobacteraeota bacterium]|nr:MAG: hypothetical protein BWY64_00020 [bacterium ADurb.Bin363]HPZ06603.1 chorismate mutase [Candidatus Eremiobacteraeota bacterium]